MLRADLTDLRQHLHWVRLAAQGKDDLVARESNETNRARKVSLEQIARDIEFAHGLHAAADWIAAAIERAENRMERRA